MKTTKFLKSLLVGASLLASAFVADAQILLNKGLTNPVTLVRSGSAALHEFTIQNQDIAAATLLILDNNSATSSNIVRPSYISYGAYSRLTNTATFTNIVGVVQTNNFTYLTRSSTTNAATTNTANIVYRLNVPASTTLTIIPDDSYTFGLGIQAYWSGTNATLNGVYSPIP